MSSSKISLQCNRCSQKFSESNRPVNLGCKSQHLACEVCIQAIVPADKSTFECEWCAQLLNTNGVAINTNLLQIINLLKIREQAVTAKFNSQIQNLKGIIRDSRESVKRLEKDAENFKAVQNEVRELKQSVKNYQQNQLRQEQQHNNFEEIKVKYQKLIESQQKMQQLSLQDKQQIQHLKEELTNQRIKVQQENYAKMKIHQSYESLESQLKKQIKIKQSLLNKIDQQGTLINKYKSIFHSQQMKTTLQTCWNHYMGIMVEKLKNIQANQHRSIDNDGNQSQSDYKRLDEAEQTNPKSIKVSESTEKEKDQIEFSQKIQACKRQQPPSSSDENKKQSKWIDQIERQEKEQQCQKRYIISNNGQTSCERLNKVEIQKQGQNSQVKKQIDDGNQPESLLQSSFQEESNKLNALEQSPRPFQSHQLLSNSKEKSISIQKKTNQTVIPTIQNTTKQQTQGTIQSLNKSKQESKQNCGNTQFQSIRENESQPNWSFNNSIKASSISNRCSQNLSLVNQDDYFENYDYEEDDMNDQSYQNQSGYYGEYFFAQNQKQSQCINPQQQYKQYPQQQQYANPNQYVQKQYSQQHSYPQQHQYSQQQYGNQQYSQQSYNSQKYKPQPQALSLQCNQKVYDYRGQQYGQQGYWLKVQQQQEQQPNFPARFVSEFKNNKKFMEDVLKDSIVQLLKQIDKSKRFSEEEIFMIANLEKKKNHATLKLEIINRIKKSGDTKYFALYNQILNCTLSTIKQVNLQRSNIERMISLAQLSALQKLDLSYNCIKKIEGIETNIPLRYLILNNNAIERIENIGKLRDLHLISIHQNKLRKQSAEVIKRSNYDKLQELSIGFLYQNASENIYCLQLILSKHWSNLSHIYWSIASNEDNRPYLAAVEYYNKVNRKPEDKRLSIVL